MQACNKRAGMVGQGGKSVCARRVPKRRVKGERGEGGKCGCKEERVRGCTRRTR
jgi:hypothetical protein